jgi:hypothetical protein
LFGDKTPGKKNLGSTVRNCLDSNGTYILICFKQDPTEEQRNGAVEKSKELFKAVWISKSKSRNMGSI